MPDGNRLLTCHQFSARPRSFTSMLGHVNYSMNPQVRVCLRHFEAENACFGLTPLGIHRDREALGGLVASRAGLMSSRSATPAR